MEPILSKKKRSGILTKMVVFMLFIAIMPLIIAAISIKTFNDLHQQEIEDRQEEVVKQIGNAIDKELSGVAEQLSAELSGRESQGAARAIFRTIPAVELVTFVDARTGEDLFADSPRYEVPPFPEAENLGASPLLEAVRKDGKPKLSPLRSTMTGPKITIAVPAGERTLFAVIGMSDILRDIIAGNQNPRAGYVYLTDHEGRLLAKGGAEIAAPVSLRSTPLVGSLLYKDNIKTEGQKRYQSYWDEAVVGSGHLKLVAGMERPLGIFVELPAADADFIFGQLVGRFTAITALLVILTLILSFYLTVTLVRPIRELERGTERAAQGEFETPVSIQSGDELEELGEAFNGMMKGLKELAELREEFVFVAAHELRAPVSIIKGYLTLLLEGKSGPVEPQVRTQLEKEKTANERLVQLINDLLEVSREEAGRLEIKVEPVDMAQAVAKVITDAQRLADEKRIKLSYKPGRLPLVLADSGRIGEIAMNLISNAIKYSPEGTTVTVSHEVKRRTLVTKVADAGFGISAEDQKKLFEKFYRIKTDKTANITGTGLGLFIVKKILEKMGGTIWVESKEGKGSTFSFDLPLAK